MHHHKIVPVLAIAASLTVAGAASAWTPIATCGGNNLKWAGSFTTMRALNVSFPAGPWRNALSEVRTRWFNQPSLFSFSVLWDDPAVALGNGQNEVWWSNGFGAPAVTNYWFNPQTCTFNEADVRFDNTVSYHYTRAQGSLWPYGGAFRPFHTTAMHEFGHVAGLGHEADVYNIMGQDWDHIHGNCGLAYAYPGEDAVSGAVSLYGPWSGSKEELGVAPWRRTGASGAYSVHNRTRLLNSSGVELAKWTSSPEPVYRVNKGQVVRLEMTYENMGKTSPLTADARIYLSTNSCISTVDTVLQSFWVNQSRNTPFTITRTITIPGSLTSGSFYWLGANIDDPAAFTEFYDTLYENASYIGIRVN